MLRLQIHLTKSAILMLLMLFVVSTTGHDSAAQTKTNWRGGEGLWPEAENWTNGVPGSNVFATIDLDDSTPSHVTVLTSFPESTTGGLAIGVGDILELRTQGRLVVLNQDAVDATCQIVNRGEIKVTSTPIPENALTRLSIGSDTVFRGGGKLTLGGVNPFLTRISGQAGNGFAETLTNSNHTIQGAGQFESLLMIVNEFDGIIDANALGEFLELGATINRGVMRASDGGVLLIDNFVENEDGLIQALDLSNIRLDDNADIVGGRLETTASGAVQVHGDVRLTDVDFSGQMLLQNSADLFLVGEFKNEGVFSD